MSEDRRDDIDVPLNTRTRHQERVEDLMRKANQPIPNFPTVPDDKTILLRARLMMEEVLETIHAMGVFVYCLNDNETDMGYSDVFMSCLDFEKLAPSNIVEVADGCADVSVVTIGTASAFGIGMAPILKAVDENNLAKFGPGHSYREDGKLIKPPGHKPPDLKSILIAQGWTPENTDVPNSG